MRAGGNAVGLGEGYLPPSSSFAVNVANQTGAAWSTAKKGRTGIENVVKTCKPTFQTDIKWAETR